MANNGQMPGHPVIQIELMPGGSIRAGCNLSDRVIILGMLEVGKMALMRQLDEQQKGPKVAIPPPGMGGLNLRG